MLHMISSFDLRQDANLERFYHAVTELYSHLIHVGLLVSVGPICQRFADTPMDTDEIRPHGLLFTTTFRDQAQCDQAYDYIAAKGSKAARLHAQMMACVADNAVFSCWREMDSLC